MAPDCYAPGGEPWHPAGMESLSVVRPAVVSHQVV